MEARFHEEKLRLQQQHDLSVQKVCGKPFFFGEDFSGWCSPEKDFFDILGVGVKLLTFIN